MDPQSDQQVRWVPLIRQPKMLRAAASEWVEQGRKGGVCLRYLLGT